MHSEHGRSAPLEVRVRARAGSMRLGDQLVAEGLVTRAQLDQALEHQRRRSLRIGEALFELGLISSPDLSRVLAQRRGLPFVDLMSTPIDPATVRSLPASMVHRLAVVPIAAEGETVVLAMVNPEDGEALGSVRRFLNRPVRVVMCDPEGALAVAEAIWGDGESDEAEPDPDTAASIARHLAARRHAGLRLEQATSVDTFAALADAAGDLVAHDTAAWRTVYLFHSVRVARFLGGEPGAATGDVGAARHVQGWPGEDERVAGAVARLAAEAARVDAALDHARELDPVLIDDLTRDLERVLTCFAAALAPDQRTAFGIEAPAPMA